MEYIFRIINYPFDIFFRLLESTGLNGFFIGMFTIFCSYRFLIKPISGTFSRSAKIESKKRNKED